MSQNFDQIALFAEKLHTARRQKHELPPLSQTATFGLSDAYKIQSEGIQMRLNDGEKIIGYKMGLTSKAKMEQMGLHQPIYGVLTDAMQIKNSGALQLTQHIHPKAEPEIYFVTNKDLNGKITVEQAQAACSQVGVALEILDSRYKGFKYFTLPDVVADNSSSAYFILGSALASKNFDLAPLSITLNVNNKTLYKETGAAILGNPWLSLCELVAQLSDHGQMLPAGSVVLAGAATAAVALEPGMKVMAQLENCGTAELNVNA